MWVGNQVDDANGNTLTDAQGRSFTWDFENRLTQAVNPEIGTTTFRYDPFGRRIGNGGQRLKFERHYADYDPNSDFPDTNVQRCIAQAQTLVAGIDRNIPEGFSSGRSRIQRLITYVRRFL